MKKMMNRMQQPTPPFFKKLRNIGLTVAAIGTSIIAAPVAMPVLVAKLAGYLALAGTVMSTVSQAAVAENNE